MMAAASLATTLLVHGVCHCAPHVGIVILWLIKILEEDFLLVGR